MCSGLPQGAYARMQCQEGIPTWTSLFLSGSPSARHGHTAVMDGSDRMWVHGGYDGSSEPSSGASQHVEFTSAVGPIDASFLCRHGRLLE